MAYAIVPIYVGTKNAAAVVTNIVLMAGVTALSYIHRTGSTFITDGTVAGDGAIITTSGLGNDGTHLIVSIPDEETLIVRAALTNEAGIANVQVTTGDHLLNITDELVTDWDTIVTAVAEPAYIAKHDTRQSTLVGANSDFTIFEHTIGRIDILHSGATDTAFSSKEDVVYSRQHAIISAPWEIRQTGAQPGTLSVDIGTLLSGADRRSYREGSVWVGCKITGIQSTVVNTYGSFIVSGDTGWDAYNGGDMFGTIVIGSLAVPQSSQTGAGVNLQDLILITRGPSAGGPIVVDAIEKADNIIIADTGSFSIVAFAAGIILEGVALSDQVSSPFIAMITADVEFRDLVVDKAINTLFQLFTGGGTEFGLKSYTYNPVFTDNRGVVLSGATVSISEIDDSSPLSETPISGSPFTTDANGQLLSGAGVILITQDIRTISQTVTDFSYRVKVEQAGFMLTDYLAKPTHKFEGNQTALHRYQPALEGEEATL